MAPQRTTSARPQISADELKLLATSTADLEKRAYVSSFDEEDFRNRLNGDRWQQIIQAHLYLDHVLTLTISETLINPDAIRLKQMGFAQKLELARALGLVSEPVAQAAAKVNGLRNRIAHDLAYEIADREVTDLSNATPVPVRESVTKSRKTLSIDPLSLAELLYGIVWVLETGRQMHTLGRLQSKKGEIRLRTVLENTPGVNYIP